MNTVKINKLDTPIQDTATGPQTHLSKHEKTPREIGKPGLYARKKDWLNDN